MSCDVEAWSAWEGRLSRRLKIEDVLSYESIKSKMCFPMNTKHIAKSMKHAVFAKHQFGEHRNLGGKLVHDD